MCNWCVHNAKRRKKDLLWVAMRCFEGERERKKAAVLFSKCQSLGLHKYKYLFLTCLFSLIVIIHSTKQFHPPCGLIDPFRAVQNRASCTLFDLIRLRLFTMLLIIYFSNISSLYHICGMCTVYASLCIISNQKSSTYTQWQRKGERGKKRK